MRDRVLYFNSMILDDLYFDFEGLSIFQAHSNES